MMIWEWVICTKCKHIKPRFLSKEEVLKETSILFENLFTCDKCGGHDWQYDWAWAVEDIPIIEE